MRGESGPPFDSPSSRLRRAVASLMASHPQVDHPSPMIRAKDAHRSSPEEPGNAAAVIQRACVLACRTRPARAFSQERRSIWETCMQQIRILAPAVLLALCLTAVPRLRAATVNVD